MTNSDTGSLSSRSNPPQIANAASWLALLASGATLLLLAALHGLNPEFSPSWRMVSEYALGH